MEASESSILELENLIIVLIHHQPNHSRTWCFGWDGIKLSAPYDIGAMSQMNHTGRGQFSSITADQVNTNLTTPKLNELISLFLFRPLYQSTCEFSKNSFFRNPHSVHRGQTLAIIPIIFVNNNSIWLLILRLCLDPVTHAKAWTFWRTAGSRNPTGPKR